MNQKRKNGFTLIELLAVIVILAIIALIAVPVILNIIDKANKSAFKDTAYGVISAGELYFAEQQLELNGMQGNVEIELPDSRLQLKGDIPDGKVLITTDGKVSIAVQNGRYCITKRLDDTDVTVTDDIDNCNLPNDGTVGDIGDGGDVELPAVGTSAEDCTWEQIKAIGDAGKADEYFNLGDTKTITLTDGTSVVMEIVAFNADTKADGSGTAGISWISKDLVARRTMNSTKINAGGWKESEMRSWLQGEFYATLPAEVKDSIVNVSKTYYNNDSSTRSCTDNVWIPSAREIIGYSTSSFETSSVVYVTVRTKNYGGSADCWWLRSASQNRNDRFRYIGTGGELASNGNATYSFGVALGFCT